MSFWHAVLLLIQQNRTLIITTIIPAVISSILTLVAIFFRQIRRAIVWLVTWAWMHMRGRSFAL